MANTAKDQGVQLEDKTGDSYSTDDSPENHLHRDTGVEQHLEATEEKESWMSTAVSVLVTAICTGKL